MTSTRTAWRPAKKRDMERARSRSRAGVRSRPPECGHNAGEPRERVRRFRRPREAARHPGARARDRRADVRPRPPGSGHHHAKRDMLDARSGARTVRRDYAKARDVLERALAINERAYGRPHERGRDADEPRERIAGSARSRATTRMRLEAASRRLRRVERALAIEQAYSRDHASGRHAE